jgi:hypothetical protein
MPKITINANNFRLGESTTDYSNDGGFSPIDRGCNIGYTEGLLLPTPSTTDAGTVDGDVICYGLTESSTGTTAIALTDNGKFYSLDSVSMAPTLGQTDSTNTYEDWCSDIVFWDGNFYATSKTDIALLSPTLSTLDEDWWTGTKTQPALDDDFPHQMLVFNDDLYITDKNKIYSYDGTLVTTHEIVEDNQNITAFIEYNGEIYIATEPYYNRYSDNHGRGFIYIWDGISAYPRDKKPIEAKIISFYVFSGLLYAFNAFLLTVWNGLNFEKVYKTNYNVYKHQITEYEKKLFFTDNATKWSGVYSATYPKGYSVCCYEKEYERFYHPFQYLSSSTQQRIKALLSYDDYTFLLGLPDKIARADFTSSDGQCMWRSNRYEFGQNVKIKSILVELSEELSSAEQEIRFYDHLGTNHTIGTMTSGKIAYYDNIGVDTTSLQLRIYFKTNAKPVKSITIEYEPTEQPIRTS